MIELIKSLRKLVLGETWTIPAGVAGTLGAAVLTRAVLPKEAWASVGGFVVATLVITTLLLSLRIGR